ncbi:MAG: hypothetical protein MHM6MM_009497 [Cercozoa sp. M6MM]
MEFDEDGEFYHYPCPCGDQFQIALEQLMDGEEIARCPSCSLIIRVIYDAADFMEESSSEEESSSDEDSD